MNIIIKGYAPDGGLYFPERIPKLEAGQLESWKSLSYPDIVKKIMKMFISQDEIPVEDLHRIVDDAFQRLMIWNNTIISTLIFWPLDSSEK